MRQFSPLLLLLLLLRPHFEISNPALSLSLLLPPQIFQLQIGFFSRREKVSRCAFCRIPQGYCQRGLFAILLTTWYELVPKMTSFFAGKGRLSPATFFYPIQQSLLKLVPGERICLTTTDCPGNPDRRITRWDQLGMRGNEGTRLG